YRSCASPRSYSAARCAGTQTMPDATGSSWRPQQALPGLYHAPASVQCFPCQARPKNATTHPTYRRQETVSSEDLMEDEIINQDCLPLLAVMPDQSIDSVITDPPYPSPTGLFAQNITDGIAALYLCAKKAKKHVVFFWSPLADVPRPPPGWFHTATHI